MSVDGDLKRLWSLVRQLQGALGGNRIIAGTVDSAGNVVSGSGFTSAKTGTGLYTVTFSTAFAGAPAISLTPGAAGQDVRWNTLAAGSVTLTTFLSSPVTLADAGFSFVAVGPP